MFLDLKLIESSPSLTYSTSSTTTSSSTDGGAQKGEVRTWLDGLNSPLIQDEGENKMLKLRFDVSQYQPEEIVVKTVDNKLLEMKKNIRGACAAIPSTMLRNVRKSYVNRIRMCRQQDGNQFEQFLQSEWCTDSLQDLFVCIC
ncbi:hypothetical protein C0J52_21280 [Blattella germanica]|nr:hypothetical protein C0J52_21280 [Blattella germanica]